MANVVEDAPTGEVVPSGKSQAGNPALKPHPTEGGWGQTIFDVSEAKCQKWICATFDKSSKTFTATYYYGGVFMSKQTASVSHGRCAARHDARLYTPNNVYKEMMGEDIHFVYEPVKDAFQNAFGSAIEEYNSRQKRKDRMKDNYYKEIVDGQYTTDENGKRTRVKNAPHPEYEYVFQYGNRDTNPASIVNENGTRVLGPNAVLSRAALKEFFEEFQKANPHLYITGASIHLDESTPHLHIRFIPVAEGYKNGMTKRCSLTKALDNMGYARGSKRGEDLALNRWLQKQKELLEDVGKKYGFEIVEGNSKGRKHIENHEWCSGLGDIITKLEREAAEAKESAEFNRSLASHEESRAKRVHEESEAIIKQCSEEIEKAKDIMQTTLENKTQYLSEVKRLKSEESPLVQFHHAISSFIKTVKKAKSREEIINAALYLFKPFSIVYEAIKNISGFENRHNIPKKEREAPGLIQTVEDLISSASARSEATQNNSNDKEKEQEL